jgi:hypothetical protein
MKVLAFGSTAVFALLMLLSGVGDLLRYAPFVEDLRRLGYPDYLLPLLGTLKLLGVAAILHPRTRILKEWAYAGFSFDLGGAAISQIISQGTAVQILPPFVCAGALAASYWGHRRRAAA